MLISTFFTKISRKSVKFWKTLKKFPLKLSKIACFHWDFSPDYIKIRKRPGGGLSTLNPIQMHISKFFKISFQIFGKNALKFLKTLKNDKISIKTIKKL